jgi:hypothetical protein
MRSLTGRLLGRLRPSRTRSYEHLDQDLLAAIAREPEPQLFHLEIAVAALNGEPTSGPDLFVTTAEWASSAFERELIAMREGDLVLSLTDRGREHLTALQRH